MTYENFDNANTFADMGNGTKIPGFIDSARRTIAFKMKLSPEEIEAAQRGEPLWITGSYSEGSLPPMCWATFENPMRELTDEEIEARAKVNAEKAVVRVLRNNQRMGNERHFARHLKMRK